MTELMHKVEATSAVAEIRAALTGRRCWYGYISFGNTFQIALGKKVLRDREELVARRKMAARRAARGRLVKKDPRHQVFERYTGEANLLVWCSWRLDGEKAPITSWDDESARAEEGIRGLIGRTVAVVTIEGGWNLKLEFSGGLALNVFPDHVGPSASFDGNWEVWKPNQAYLIGTDLACGVLDREHRPARPVRRSLARDRRPKVSLRRVGTTKEASA